MTRASDNAFPSLLITEGTEPSAPAAGKQRLYIDSTTHKLKRTDSSGVDVTIEGGGAGGVAADTIWDTAGDIAVATGADTAAKLALGASGQVLRSTGSALAYAYPPGFEIGYDQITSSINVASTTEASGTTLISCSAYTFDGAPVICQVFFPQISSPGVASSYVVVTLFEGATQIGRLGIVLTPAGAACQQALNAMYRFTPSAASHTYTVKAFASTTSGTPAVSAGSGGTGVSVPGFCRFTKV